MLKSTSIIHIDRAAIEIYKESQPFNNILAVKGIFKMHVIEVSGSETKLWRNCTFQKMALPDIHLKPKKASPETESEILRLVEIEEGQMNKPEEGLSKRRDVNYCYLQGREIDRKSSYKMS